MVVYDPMAQQAQDDEVIDFRELLKSVLKRKWVVVSVLLIALVSTILATSLMIPVYRAGATIEMSLSSDRILNYQNFTAQGSGGYADLIYFINSQIAILRSREIAENVIRNEGLENHPEFTGEIRQRSLTGEAQRLFYTFLNLFRGGGSGPRVQPSEEQLRERAIRRAANILRSRLSVNRTPETTLVFVAYDSFDGRLAARVANAVVDEYIRSNMERRFQAGSAARSFLEDQIVEMRAALERADQALLDFAQRNQVADLEQRLEMATTTLEDLNGRLSEIERDLIEVESQKTMIERGQAADVSLISESAEIRALRQRRAELAAEYASLSQRFKDDYPTLVELRNQMDEISDQIAEERTLAIRGVLGRHNRLLAEAEALRDAIERRESSILALSQQGVQYNILKREFETSRELYDGLLQRMKEIGVASGLQENNISVIDAAQPAGGPYKPNLFRNVMMALALGLAAGVGLALVLEFFDSTIHRLDDLEALSQRPVLGLVPVVKQQRHAADPRKKLEKANPNQPAVLTDRAIGHYSAKYPKSSVSEAFRSLRTSLMFSTPEGMPKTMVITSPGPGEGKTTTAINLATVMAQNGSRVLLIDADLRKPRLHRDFGKPRAPGLTNRIAGAHAEGSEASSIQATDVEGLFLMASGNAAPNPAELLSSERMTKIVAMNARAFDHIIIDSAPILGLADALVLSRVADGVIVVSASAKTTKDSIKASMKRLAQVRAPVIGMVLNAVDLDSPDYAYYSSYYYNYESEDESASEPEPSKKSRGLLGRTA